VAEYDPVSCILTIICDHGCHQGEHMHKVQASEKRAQRAHHRPGLPLPHFKGWALGV
jgi:hypothetical protein